MSLMKLLLLTAITLVEFTDAGFLKMIGREPEGMQYYRGRTENIYALNELMQHRKYFFGQTLFWKAYI